MEMIGMEQLKLLANYTIFHIGVYISLSTGLVALLGLFAAKADVMKAQLFIALGCFLFAGICGGIVAANIPYSTNLQAFVSSRIGFFGWPLIPARHCMTLEHLSFWAGVGFALWGLSKVARHEITK